MSVFISCSNLSFCWPDGTVVFDRLDLLVGPGRSGLVGHNGSGKSTLLRLISGDLTAQHGSVSVSGRVGYLSQDLILDVSSRVDAVLGVDRTRRALHEIEAGIATEENLARIGDDWDVEDRAGAMLDRLGLAPAMLDRRVGELSGGEAVLLGLAARLLAEPDVLLLDEPTNNLDRSARARLHRVVESWTGALLVVSHDRELLDVVDQIGDLHKGEVRWYGGGFGSYEQALAVEQTAADRDVRQTRSNLRKQQQELVEARIKLDRRRRYGQKMWDNKREPKIVMGARKREAQVSAAKHRNLHRQRVAEAAEKLTAAESQVRGDDEIRIDLPDTRLPATRDVLRLDGMVLRTGQRCSVDLRGPERIALVGPNGAGKSTLLHTVAGDLDPAKGAVDLRVPFRLLPQRIDTLDEEESVLANVRRFAPEAGDNAGRARLARFLFRGPAADRTVATLSGGERFRAALAALLLAEPAPQLLMLDEPTNNLDLASVHQLTTALESYEGALLVASHDVPFLRDLGITRWLELTDALIDIDPL